MSEIKQKLKTVFGYDSFRPLQEEIISNILSKRDSLIIMPTGGGKSLCYQIPALLFKGLTVVISPLISLMKDQVEQLKQLGVDAVVLNSSLTPEEYSYNFNCVKSKKAKMLYLAPESLFKDDIQWLLNEAGLESITVDEAHCISEWGHDFRKEYRQLGILRTKYPDAVCAALTATATPRVQDDIVKNLNLVNSQKFVASFDRKNLFLQVVPKLDPFLQTVEFLNEHKNQSGIIYCFSRRQVDELHEDLSGIGFSTKPYHAGLSDAERVTNQDLFTNDKVDIIIATIAFGMGINKSNVRFVIHYDLPKNLESYYQEIGRSGRDGVRADCLLLFSGSDTAKINYFINQKEDAVERISAKAHLDAMVRYAEYDGCRRQPLITYFGEHYSKVNCGMCDNCIAEAKVSEDITIAAQKFLSAVKRTGEIFGAGYIIDVLTGSEQEKILRNGHHNLTVYGIGKEYTKVQWKQIPIQLLNKNYLTRDVEFGGLKLTPSAIGVLFKKEKVFGRVEAKVRSSTKRLILKEDYDEELFEILRQKRRQIAEARNVPPYVIFSDRTLIEMAKELPQNEFQLSKISGIGEKKIKSYGSIFLILIKSYCAQKNIPAKKSVVIIKKTERKRYIEVGQEFNKNISVESIAETMGVKRETIIKHLFDYVLNGNKLNPDYLQSEVNSGKELQKNILNEFKREGTSALSPLKEKFGDAVTYDDLHLLRIIFLNKSK
ncbi:MAG: ATP-dependent DNA helicase RecQ [Ignavibacteria bacterium CG2_30_36_16]|nr:MAG: ATP-dependent DNA helicase RecQ [Ignavibacteria bacterium CG2_30_36_16]